MEWLVGNGGGGSVEYTGGHGIDVDNANHIISVDQYEIQDKLTAGNNITITNNVISAADQVQSDWTELDTSSKAYIAHKPTIPTATSDLTNDSNFITASDVPSSQVQSDWTESDSSDPAYIAHKPTLAAVATSGNYSDLSNTPSIPTATSDLQNDSGFITASDIPAQVQSDWTESDTTDPAYIANKPTLATVATSGSYNDLSNTPTIPSGNQLLPSATPSDEGKVLAVDSSGNPIWRTLPPVSGGDIYFAEYNVTSYADVVAAYTAGKTIVVKSSNNWAFPSEIQYADSLDLYTFIFTTNFTSWVQNGNSIDITATHHTFFRLTSSANHPTLWYRETYDNRPLPKVSDFGKVLTCEANGSGTGPVVRWVTPQTFTQVQSDWTESDTTDASFIQNKPTTKPIAAGTGISVVEYADNITINNTATQVQSDWAESTSTEPDYIKNKPTVKQIVAGTNVTINESSSQITISSIGAGGVPVQADWTQADSNQPDYIKNKPAIPAAQVQSNWTESDTTNKSFILNKPVTKPIVAGNGIVITETATEIVISLA